jgi:hypothetical protein
MGLSLSSTTYKILSNILLSRLTPYAGEIIGYHQCGFRRRRSTADHTFCIRQILEKKWELNETVHQLFMDLKETYDSVRSDVLYHILGGFGIPMKLARLVKVCLSEICNRVKRLFAMFHIKSGLKQGDALTPLLFDVALDYAIRRAQINQDGLKVNATFQLLFYVDDVNMLGGSLHTANKTYRSLIVASKETGLEVNADEN